MSHELEQHPDGSTAFVAGHNLDVWHRLGTVLPERLTAADVMTYAHLAASGTSVSAASRPPCSTRTV